jgi:hypothetical protein
MDMRYVKCKEPWLSQTQKESYIIKIKKGVIREVESNRQNVKVEKMFIELKKIGLPNQVFYIINASLSTFHQTSSQHEGQPSSLWNIAFPEIKSSCANTIGALMVSLISCRNDNKCVNKIIKSLLK